MQITCSCAASGLADPAFAPASRSGRYGDHGVAVTGGVEVGVDFSQSREVKPFAQLADGEGAERDLVLVRLDLAAGLKDEHQMGNVILAQVVGYLPGIEHQASPPPASHQPVGNLNDLALSMELLPVA